MRSFALLSLFGAVHGLIGYGIEMYKPLCAYSCRAPIRSVQLSCTNEDHAASGGGHSHSATGPDCFAKDTSFLTTLASCIQKHCEPLNVEPWLLEKYWAEKTTGDPTVLPKWTYTETLMEITEAPTTVVNTSKTLDYTGVVSEARYLAAFNAMGAFEEQETWHATFGLVLLGVGAGVPIALTWLGYLPVVPRIYAKAAPYLIMPALIKKYASHDPDNSGHVRPLPFSLGNAPTAGQAAYILLFLLVNIIVTSVPYATYSPSSYFEDSKSELLSYIANRTGVLAFALFPLTILFAGRNNILLALTNWSHSTYLLLHRWVARVLTVQIVLHSLLEVVLYKHTGSYDDEVSAPYWVWGIVATVLACAMLVLSTLWFRRAAYEVFLVLHILLAVLVLVGSWMHVELLFERKWGYQHWLYAAFAVWAVDRAWRVIRIARAGKCDAEVTEVGDGIVRVDIPGVRWGAAANPGQHLYAYFPGLKGRAPWEAHPFSVVPLLAARPAGPGDESLVSDSDSSTTREGMASDIEKEAASGSVPRPLTTKQVEARQVGVRLYCRRHKGLTQKLVPGKLTALLEGPYYNHNHSLSGGVMDCDRLLLFAGGIGITGVAGFVYAHPRSKLYWSVRQETTALVEDIKGSGALVRLGRDGLVVRTGGERFDFTTLLAEEIGKGERVGVVVCGPPGFCDDLRDAVARLGRSGLDVRLAVEAFSW